ncbi:MAG: hypothetical protein QM680_01290 [Luteolibacter sp.]
MNLSQPYELAPGNITLKLAAQIPLENQPLPEGLPADALPETVKNCYLLVVSDPSNKIIPLKMRVINASPQGFGVGQSMWVNLTPYIIGGKVGSVTLNIKPNTTFISAPPAAGLDDCPVQLGYADPSGKGARQFYSTVWRHDPTGRNVIFVTASPKSKIPKITGFPDFRVSESQEKEGAEGN